MFRRSLLAASLLFSLFGTNAFAADNVRFIKIEPPNSRIVMKNFGDTAVDMSSWYFSSNGSNLAMTSTPVVVESGSINLAAGAEITIRFTSSQYLASKDEELALFDGGSIFDEDAMVDFVQWEFAGGPREPVANTKGIWTTNAFLSLGDFLCYTGDGTDTGPREGLWASRSVNVRLLSVNPTTNRFTLKNFGSENVEVGEWFFTAGNTNTTLSLTSISVVSGSTNLAPGATVTYEYTIPTLLDASGGALAVHRGAAFSANGMVDFVQWIVTSSFRQALAVTKGIWTNQATLPAGTSYHYHGDGTDTEAREVYWTNGVLPQAKPINLRISETPGGFIKLDFDTVVGRVYLIRRSGNLQGWSNVAPNITPAGSTSTWTDSNPVSSFTQRYYQVLDVTLLP